MVTIYNYAFNMLGDCVVTLFELLTHILNSFDNTHNNFFISHNNSFKHVYFNSFGLLIFLFPNLCVFDYLFYSRVLITYLI